MTAKIKLNAASGGGSVSLQAPSSTGDDRVITLPTTADGTVLTTTNPKAGNIIQVVSATSTTAVSSSSASHTDTGLSCSITTTSSSSKVYVSVSQALYVRNPSGDTASISWDLVRGSTVISDGSSNIILRSEAYSPYVLTAQMASFVYLDSPGSAATHTYKTTALTNDGNWKAQDNSTPSHMVLMEVAA
jgi:hypothetical protein